MSDGPRSIEDLTLSEFLGASGQFEDNLATLRRALPVGLTFLEVQRDGLAYVCHEMVWHTYAASAMP
jgi:hypothetical protein